MPEHSSLTIHTFFPSVSFFGLGTLDLIPAEMSRHQLVKNLDLDDELDDFDGGEEYGYDGEDALGEGLYTFTLVNLDT